MPQQKTLVFISTRFLFPIDSGGKIRTTQVLRGLKGGAFRVVLLSPASDQLRKEFAAELESVCDEFRWWPQEERGPLFSLTRMRYLASEIPIPVRTDRSPAGETLIRAALAESPDVVVADFAHAAVLVPEKLPCPSVMFTHNVEAEIFRRHRDVAGNPLLRWVWADQYRKMRRFEGQALARFDVVVAVAARDSAQFEADYGSGPAEVIPTGVDLDFFAYAPPERHHDVVFLGSMDWAANQDGIRFFMDDVWGSIAERVPSASMTVVGRAPPDSLVREARRRAFNWTFTGFVDDVRPHVAGAAVSVIPLRVGGGTRLKVYEAMAMGSAVVSTAIGVEGLPVTAGEHYLNADTATDFADSVVTLLTEPARCSAVSQAARRFVDENFSYTVAAKAFEDACLLAIERHRGAVS